MKKNNLEYSRALVPKYNTLYKIIILILVVVLALLLGLYFGAFKKDEVEDSNNGIYISRRY